MQDAVLNLWRVKPGHHRPALLGEHSGEMPGELGYHAGVIAGLHSKKIVLSGP